MVYRSGVAYEPTAEHRKKVGLHSPEVFSAPVILFASHKLGQQVNSGNRRKKFRGTIRLKLRSESLAGPPVSLRASALPQQKTDA
jgi:hypothetical protein